jgi:preprotein translocase subunit SecG
MQTVIIVVHLMVVLALIGVVLLQRSDGSALGIGGGGGFMTGRGQANALTRATAILAAMFFLTSLTLTILANVNRAPKSIFDSVPQAGQNSAPAQPGQAPEGQGGGGLLDQLKQLDQQSQQGQQGQPTAPPPSK